MPGLLLGPIADDKPVSRTVKLTAALDASLRAYADIYEKKYGAITVERLIPAMLERFMRTDREFARFQRTKSRAESPDR